jgi:hypothetical protein
MESLIITTLNSRGFNASKPPFINDLLLRSDIVLHQEHWLSESQLPMLCDLNSDFLVSAISGFDCSHVLQGRPFGGCAIFLRKSIDLYFERIECDSRRIIALLLKFKDVKLLLFNVYMPYESSINSDDFLMQLSLISDIIDRFPDAQVIIGGDFNTDFNRACSQTQILRDFSARNGLIPCSQLAGYDVDYTYHQNGDRLSTIDRFMLSPALASAPEIRVTVDHSVDNTSDHDPVTLYLPIHVDRIRSQPAEHMRAFAWYKCSSKQLNDYADQVNEILACLEIPTESLVCSDIFCTNSYHLCAIQTYGSAIIHSCLHAANNCIPYTGATNKKRTAGWATKVQPYKDRALFWHHIWTEMNRPHTGVVAQIRRETRAAYHRAIRSAIREEDESARLKFAECLLKNDKRDFWNEVKKIRRHDKTVPTVVDNCNSPERISNVFAESYAKLYSSVPSKDDELGQVNDQIQGKLKSCKDRFTITRDDVIIAVQHMKSGKREGDSLFSSDCIINAPDTLHVHLSMLISALFNHGFVMDELTVSTIVPILKQRLDACNSSNYRSIALCPIIGKLIDLVLLHKLADKLVTSDLQFGFKKGHSTTMCTQLLKETVAYYTSNNSSVYCVMLDASKAFDRVSYAKLFIKLLNRNISPIVIRLLMALYCNQSYCVKWNHIASAPFPVLNGVRQGAVCSPVFFCVYLDGLLQRLENTKAGCFVGNFYLGALCYADDLTLLAPSATAMRILLSTCEEYANEHAMSFNAVKSKCILFKPRSAATLDRPPFTIAGMLIEYTNSWPHLGNIINETEDDHDCISARRIQLIGQINNVLCTFGKLGAATKENLLYKLCSSLYGSVTWDLSHPDVNRICTTWRIALRRIWHLPPNAHSDIVSALGCERTLFDDLCNRTLKFIMFCLYNRYCNNTVNFIVRNSLFVCRSLSPLGRNFSLISSRYNFNPSLIHEPNNFSLILSCLSNFCTSQFDNVCTPSFVFLRESILLRNNLLDFDPTYETLSVSELDDIITLLCTQ